MLPKVLHHQTLKTALTSTPTVLLNSGLLIKVGEAVATATANNQPPQQWQEQVNKFKFLLLFFILNFTAHIFDC